MNAALTSEQAQAVANGHLPLRLTDPNTNQDYFLIKAETFERLQQLLSNDTTYTSADALDRIMAEDDANDSYLAELQRKYGGVQG